MYWSLGLGSRCFRHGHAPPRTGPGIAKRSYYLHESRRGRACNILSNNRSQEFPLATGCFWPEAAPHKIASERPLLVKAVIQICDSSKFILSGW